MSGVPYSGLKEARDGSEVPVCGTLSLHSSYNPVREAEQFARQFDSNTDFFIIQGLAGGYHIEALTKQFPAATIVAIECTDSAIDYLSAIPCVQRLTQNPSVCITDIDSASDVLKRIFQPVKYRHLQIAGLRAWEELFPNDAARLTRVIKEALSDISADFSVQSHFGGLWQRNIFSNLKLVAKAQKQNRYQYDFSAPKGKTAAIIAAGPSLDSTAKILKSNRESFFIIATDTAYSALLARGITSDACISIDAQQISHTHFFETHKETLFIFDICANPAAVRRIFESGLRFTCVETGHPLSRLAATCGSFPCFHHLETGNGTVTVAAAACAKAAGFTDIACFGADFAYLNGKPYTAGCYLDVLYNSKSVKTETAEAQFSRLMFRTEVTKTENGITTPVLTSYKEGLEVFMAGNGFTKGKANYAETQKHVSVWKSASVSKGIHGSPFNLTQFLSEALREENEVLLLPYAAWLGRKRPELKYKEILMLAKTHTLEYTDANEI